jgi:uncharacterized protein YozE (UPF0346 family)
MRTYYNWLMKQTYRNDEVGELARYFKLIEFPKKKTKRLFISFLITQEKDLDTFYQSWDEYQKFKKEII